MLKPRQKIIIQASWVSIIGNAILAVLKIVLGFISGSLAVVADGIDSASDIVTSTITLVTARLLSKPPNIKYPYGYEKADAIATKALSFVIFFAGAQLAIATTRRFFLSETLEMPGKLAIIITVISIFGKIFLAFYLKKKGDETSSSMLLANGKNMQNDIVISISVLLGLVFIYFLKLPVIDIIIALGVSLWIMWSGVQIFLKTNVELMDGMKDPELYCELFNAVKKVEGAHNPHRVRVRKLGSFHMISMDLEVESTMTVLDAHEVAKNVEDEIKATIPNVYDIVVHLEPLGNTEQGEKFGLKEGDVRS